MSVDKKDLRGRMQHLLSLSIEELISRIEGGDADAATINAATKLLKDNSIDVSVSLQDQSAARLKDATENVAIPFPAQKFK